MFPGLADLGVHRTWMGAILWLFWTVQHQLENTVHLCAEGLNLTAGIGNTQYILHTVIYGGVLHLTVGLNVKEFILRLVASPLL